MRCLRRFCANDPASLYLGQTRDLRDRHGLPLPGYESVRACLLENGGPGLLYPVACVSLAFARQVRHRWRGMCSYAGDAKQGKAMCQRRPPNGKWAWEASAADYNPGFICGMSTGTAGAYTGPVASSWKEPVVIAALVAVRGIPHAVASINHKGSDCFGSAHESAVTRRRCSVVRTSVQS